MRILTIAICLMLIAGASTVYSRPSTISAQRDSTNLTGMVTVEITPKPVNTFIPTKALGAGVDGLEKGAVAQVYTPANLRAMSQVGFGPLTYRLRTELGVEAWHWNPRGQWTNPKTDSGYWTSSSTSTVPIALGHGYKLPRRGSTTDQANNDGYSRIDDGDMKTFWKSNPYLDSHFTGEPNSAHPQWIVVDLGKRAMVDAMRIQWGVPYATHYRIAYWRGLNDPSDGLDQTYDADSHWIDFPGGAISKGQAGEAYLRLCKNAIRARFVRIWMMESSETAPRRSLDIRDHCGYAIREVELGATDKRGALRDLVKHLASHDGQTEIYASSTDPWHTVSGRDPQVEQPGFDRVFRSSLTHGLPAVIPVGILYDTPDNAVAELRFFALRGYPIRGVELGEEPDGQYMTPEDYGALYIQWADALHKVDPTLKLGGPSLQTNIDAWTTWPDARGDNSWMNRFLRYMKRRHHVSDFNFFSFEWYPFDDVCADPSEQLLREPSILTHTIDQLRRDGVPRSIPWLITEYGYSAFAGQAEMEMPGALFNAETAAQFLTLGGASAYLYGLEPNTPIQESTDCKTFGNLAVYLSDDRRVIRSRLATYYGARMLTNDWAMPMSAKPHDVYVATSNLKNLSGQPLVTAYAVHRPDGKWAVLLLNKDSKRSARIRLRFRETRTGRIAILQGLARIAQYSTAQYTWQADGRHGRPKRDLSPAVRSVAGDAINLPPYSLTVVRGSLGPYSSIHKTSAR